MVLNGKNGWFGAVAVAALVVGTVTAVHAATQPDRMSTLPSSESTPLNVRKATVMTAATTPGVTAATPGDLSSGDLEIASWMGWDIDIVTPADQLSTSEAAARSAAIRAVGRGQEVRAMSLARVTVRHWGAPADPSIEDPTEDQLILKVKDRVLWVVQFADVDMPVLGPPGRGGPDTERVDVLLLVDPDTNKVMIGQTLNGEPPEPAGDGAQTK